ncbi:MAG TPA: PLP-dependent cysteine synthase family protein [Pyrinomonadaceae bacterium]|nr:PLP-dependent cysteine synthase family protein [Pyrinomonadaceae bacterium]
MVLGVTESVLDLIGQTPLLHISRFAPPPLAGVYAKIEWLNPGGSIKDRAALGMILDAEEKGLLRHGATIIEPTAGNTGIGLALVGVARGYRVILCVPRGFAEEKMKLIAALGGEIEYVPNEAGMQRAIDRCHELAASIKGSFVPQQFENTANPCFHERSTGREIIEQMNGRVDAVVIGAGTSGTFVGVSRAVRRVNKNVLCVLVEPEGSIYGGNPPGPKKVEGIGQRDFIPKIFDASLADEIMMVSDEEVCAALKQIARLEGLLGGWSTGAAAAAAYKIAERLGAGKNVVTVFPDGAERYRSQGIFDELCA